MYQHAPRYAPFFLILLLVAAAAAGCNRSADTPTSPSTPSLQASITAEPLSAKPEFLNGPVCDGRVSFGVRVFISFRGPVVVLRTLRFQFVDLLGRRSTPDVFSLPSPSAAASSLPLSSPVTMPGIAALPPLPSDSPLGFFARFGCGIVPEGTLIITGDDNGRRSEARVMVAEQR